MYIQLVSNIFSSIKLLYHTTKHAFFSTQCSLLDVLPEMNNLKVPTELRELPDDITLAQTVALWKYIVHYQSHQRQDY